MFQGHRHNAHVIRWSAALGLVLAAALTPTTLAAAAGHGYGGGGGEGDGHGHEGEGSHRVVQIIDVTNAAFTDNFSFDQLQCQLQIPQGTYPSAAQLVVQRSLQGFSSYFTRSLGTLSIFAVKPTTSTVVAALHPEILTCTGREIGPSAFVVAGGPSSWTVVSGGSSGGLSVTVTDSTAFTFVVGEGSDLLSLGSRGDQVELLAQLLRWNGFSVAVGHGFGHVVTASMVSALESCQTSHGLAATGTTTLATWYELELK